MGISGLHLIFKACGNEDVINTPTDISGPGIGPVCPPGVVARALFEKPQCVDKAGIEETLKSLAFFLCVSLFTFILFWPGEVIGGMGDVEVSTKNHRLLLFKLLNIGEKCRVPVLFAERYAAQVILGVWRINSYQKESFVFGGNNSSFAGRVTGFGINEVIFLGEVLGESVDNGNWFWLTEDRSP